MKVIKIDCPVCSAPDVILDLESEAFADRMNRIEREIVSNALDQAGGNRAEAARSLQMAVHALRHLVIKHGLEK